MGFDYDDAKHNGISRRLLWKKTKKLALYLNSEFVIEDRLQTPEQFDSLVQKLIEYKFLDETENGDIVIHSDGMERVRFLCNLIWPLIDTYFITLLKILKMIPHTCLTEKELIK